MNRLVFIAGANRHVAGWIPDRPDPLRDKVFKAPLFSRLTLPGHMSLRNKCPPVEDQGTLGSCTANASTDALEFLRIRAGLSYLPLSRLFLYYLTRVYEGTPVHEDSGAQIRNVLKVMAASGVCPEAMWPYDVTRYAVQPPQEAYSEARRHKALFFYRCPNLMSIKASIAQGHGVIGGFSCPESMFRSAVETSGDIPYPGQHEGFNGGHCTYFMGFDDEKRRLELKNSWTDQWGRGGYGTLTYKAVDDGFADDFWTVRAAEIN